MLVIVGSVIVIVCVFGGYMGAGGHLEILWQPFEVVIICGAALGAYITANPKELLSQFASTPVMLLKGAKYNKESYLELLGLLFTIFKLAKSKGMLALETHVENPEESEIFQSFPGFMEDHHAVAFLCDYLRLFTLGTENAFELEALMDIELETHHAEQARLPDSIQTMADGLPALGIVAAVLGVIHTMGLISEPPEVLGVSIGGALVGTFLGVLVAYGFVAPTASAVKNVIEADQKYYDCMKQGLIAYVQGYAPAVSIEFARKSLFSNVRPTFYEVEDAVENLPTPGAAPPAASA
ncbi:MAG: flagellar motor stator protein MotA [Rhodospirillaceae bacterium]|jgi:chemotaxis protein MotA|nr:flagellar motor stator protein MotA [Rhodospirillaceae bacterium]MBT5373332.1 flagellar motor stator protein MotA [Rhodospirillaceae bacterium]MBT5660056.1 flagellar motor stator protein MotA [Rhodospirillaceae bacterium]